MSRWGARLRERTQPLQPDDESYDWAHAILCETLAQPFLQVTELIDPPEPHPPWGPLFDVDACPEWALPWLGQLVGAELPNSLSEEDKRTFIREVAGQQLGTTDSMKAAALSTLSSPNATLWFRERDGGAYLLEVVTRTAETPDPAATLRALLATKPASIKLTYTVLVGWDYQQMTTQGGTYTTQTALNRTYERQSEGP
jgi:P2-related tail formation protein